MRGWRWWLLNMLGLIPYLGQVCSCDLHALMIVHHALGLVAAFIFLERSQRRMAGCRIHSWLPDCQIPDHGGRGMGVGNGSVRNLCSLVRATFVCDRRHADHCAACNNNARL